MGKMFFLLAHVASAAMITSTVPVNGSGAFGSTDGTAWVTVDFYGTNGVDTVYANVNGWPCAGPLCEAEGTFVIDDHEAWAAMLNLTANPSLSIYSAYPNASDLIATAPLSTNLVYGQETSTPGEPPSFYLPFTLVDPPVAMPSGEEIPEPSTVSEVLLLYVCWFRWHRNSQKPMRRPSVLV